MKRFTNNSAYIKDDEMGEFKPFPAIVGASTGATADQVAQIEQNTAAISQLTEEIKQLQQIVEALQGSI